MRMKNYLDCFRRSKTALVSALRNSLPHSWLGSYSRFLRDGGNSLLIDGFNLGEQSQVVDIGGYLGDWSAQIHEKYGCHICVVEPVPQFFSQIEKRFVSVPPIRLFPYLISSRVGVANLFLSDDGTGYFARGTSVSVESRSVSNLLDFIGRDVIDLLMMNIEGGEYELLGLFLDHGVIAKTKHILVQFHRVAEVSQTEYRTLQSLLANTHDLVFDYPYIWQRWDLSCEINSHSSL